MPSERMLVKPVRKPYPPGGDVVAVQPTPESVWVNTQSVDAVPLLIPDSVPNPPSLPRTPDSSVSKRKSVNTDKRPVSEVEPECEEVSVSSSLTNVERSPEQDCWKPDSLINKDFNFAQVDTSFSFSGTHHVRDAKRPSKKLSAGQRNQLKLPIELDSSSPMEVEAQVLCHLKDLNRSMQDDIDQKFENYIRVNTQQLEDREQRMLKHIDNIFTGAMKDFEQRLNIPKQIEKYVAGFDLQISELALQIPVQVEKSVKDFNQAFEQKLERLMMSLLTEQSTKQAEQIRDVLQNHGTVDHNLSQVLKPVVEKLIQVEGRMDILQKELHDSFAGVQHTFSSDEQRLKQLEQQVSVPSPLVLNEIAKLQAERKNEFSHLCTQQHSLYKEMEAIAIKVHVNSLVFERFQASPKQEIAELHQKYFEVNTNCIALQERMETQVVPQGAHPSHVVHVMASGLVPNPPPPPPPFWTSEPKCPDNPVVKKKIPDLESEYEEVEKGPEHHAAKQHGLEGDPGIHAAYMAKAKASRLREDPHPYLADSRRLALANTGGGQLPMPEMVSTVDTGQPSSSTIYLGSGNVRGSGGPEGTPPSSDDDSDERSDRDRDRDKDGHPSRRGRSRSRNRRRRDSRSTSSESTRYRGHKSDAAAMKQLTLEALGQPRWDGIGLHWDQFWKEWKMFWSLNKHLYSPPAKKLLLMRCLPGRFQEHIRKYLVNSKWEYEDIVHFLKGHSKVLAPDYMRLQEWKGCMPKGRDYLEFIHWSLTWEQLGTQCKNLHQED